MSSPNYKGQNPMSEQTQLNNELHDRLPQLPEAASVGGSAGIAASLRRAIAAGEYAFNERLPAERNLAELFHTSRGTVREALRRLQDLGMVDRQVGSGTFVTYREFSEHTEIADVTSPLELIDVRLGIEPQMVRLAVANATAMDLEHMRKALVRAESAAGDSEAFSRADAEFHLALAECSRNRLIIWLYQLVNETRSHAQWAAMKESILVPERIAQYNVHHRHLYNMIAHRNLDAAIDTIYEHLDKARHDLIGVHNRSRSN
jgi:DNA-binding FadR family transcriptional regulator